MISRILALASRRFWGSILKIRCSSHKQSCFRVNAKPPPLSSLVGEFFASPFPHPKNDTNAMKQNKYQSINLGVKNKKMHEKKSLSLHPFCLPLNGKRKKSQPLNSSQIASARTCNAKPVDIERATFLWVDVDVDVVLFWRLTPRNSREGKIYETYPWDGENGSPNSMMFFLAVGQEKNV